MPSWTSRFTTSRTSRNGGSTDPQQLEAGLANQNLHEPPISEEPESSSRNNSGQDNAWKEKEDNTPDFTQRNHSDATSTPPYDTQVEDAQTEAPQRSSETQAVNGRRFSSARLFKWHHSSKQNASGQEQDNPLDEKINDGELNKTNSQDGPSRLQSPPPPEYTEEARNLVRTFTVGNYNNTTLEQTESRSNTRQPVTEEQLISDDYVPPEQYKPSIFGAILTSRLNDLREDYSKTSRPQSHAIPAEYLDLARRQAPSKYKHTRSSSTEPSAPGSGATTPKPKWYEKSDYSSSVAGLLAQAGISSTSTGLPGASGSIPHRTSPHHTKPAGMISTAVDLIQNAAAGGRKAEPKPDRRYDVVAEVADIIARRRYLIKLCGALMQFGAPTHRCEEYLSASSRALLIDAQFMYIPGAMMCTFIDNTIQSNSVELVRKREGLDFGRLKDVFNVYKCVIHEKYTPEEGIAEIDHIINRPDPYGIWFRIFVFGMASVFVGPFSFSSRPIDFGPIFILGCALGFLQLKVVPKSEHFSNVFEVTACVLAAFIARGLGSIKYADGSYIFCFSGIAQSSIAMILPGFMVLNSALELQGRSIVSGSVRMVYAIIYVLFLAFGLLVGTTVFGLIKRDATEDVTCTVPLWFSPEDHEWKLIYTRFIWAPLFACCVAIIYRAKWKQLPMMALIATCGHQANFWISTQLSSNLQVANAVGAFVIGCLAHLYSRLFHGLAAAAMLPAIYCQVPGGLAASGSLVAGINSSNQIFGNDSSVSVINNGTQGFIAAQDDPSAVYGGTIFNVGYGMVQVAIGISVGLYMSALVVYPFGKRNSGLFSF